MNVNSLRIRYSRDSRDGLSLFIIDIIICIKQKNGDGLYGLDNGRKDPKDQSNETDR